MHQQEVCRGERFQFGKNWKHFLSTLDENRMAIARKSLAEMLERPDLRNMSFLDIGSGSGLFSLAARQMGARVRSFDYDPESVACTQILKDRFYQGDESWVNGNGSVLDEDFVRSLGQFDIVYSWGVLHHTGQMWKAMNNAALAVRSGGLLYIALYNDEGMRSRIWHWIKKMYNRLPLPLRIPAASVVAILWEARALVVAIAKGQPRDYVRSWTHYADTSGRGMSKWHDIIDWIGGYPFEVAKPDGVLAFGRERDLELIRLVTTRGLGCNEYVFQRRAGPSATQHSSRT